MLIWSKMQVCGCINIRLPRLRAVGAFRPHAHQAVHRFKQPKRAGAQLMRPAAGHKIHKPGSFGTHARQPHHLLLLPCGPQQDARGKLAPHPHIQGHRTGLLPQGPIHQTLLGSRAAALGQLWRLFGAQAAHGAAHVCSGLLGFFRQRCRGCDCALRLRSCGHGALSL